jgi:transcriptional regulator with XRE-family HTH domain
MAARNPNPSALASAVGGMYRNARRTLGLSQRDLEARTGVSQSAQSRFERGLSSAVDLAAMERLALALGARPRFSLDTPFLADRAAQRDLVHARSTGFVAARLRRAGWVVDTEVQIDGSFGPGWIDVLAFQPASGCLLVVEVKTELMDVGRVQRTLGWYGSRAMAAARSRGWRPDWTQACLLVLATDAVDRALQGNRIFIREAFPMRAAALAEIVAGQAGPASGERALAMIDPLSRRQRWLRPTRLDGRTSRAPHPDYAAVARRMTVRRSGRSGSAG